MTRAPADAVARTGFLPDEKWDELLTQMSPPQMQGVGQMR